MYILCSIYLCVKWKFPSIWRRNKKKSENNLLGSCNQVYRFSVWVIRRRANCWLFSSMRCRDSLQIDICVHVYNIGLFTDIFEILDYSENQTGHFVGSRSVMQFWCWRCPCQLKVFSPHDILTWREVPI